MHRQGAGPWSFEQSGTLGAVASKSTFIISRAPSPATDLLAEKHYRWQDLQEAPIVKPAAYATWQLQPYRTRKRTHLCGALRPYPCVDVQPNSYSKQGLAPAKRREEDVRVLICLLAYAIPLMRIITGVKHNVLHLKINAAHSVSAAPLQRPVRGLRLPTGRILNSIPPIECNCT